MAGFHPTQGMERQGAASYPGSTLPGAGSTLPGAGRWERWGQLGRDCREAGGVL